MSENENNTGAEDRPVKNSILPSIGDIGQIIGALVAIAYACGFIVVTAYLGSFGIKDYEAFRIQHIIAGIILLLVCGLFYVAVGRHLLTLDQGVNYSKEAFKKLGADWKYWEFFAAIFPITELLIGIVIVTLVGSSLLFTADYSNIIYIILPIVLGLSWIRLITTSKAMESANKYFFLLVEVFYSVAFLAFVYLADGIIHTFLVFIGTIVIFGLMYVDIFSSSYSKKITGIYLVIFSLVIVSGAFGRYFYGHVRSSIGGGEPEKVRLVFDTLNIPTPIKKEINISDSISSKVDLIAQTDSEIFVGYPSIEQGDLEYKTLISIDRKLIKAVISNNVSVVKYIKIN